MKSKPSEFTIEEIASMAQGALRGLLKRTDITIDAITRDRMQTIADLKSAPNHPEKTMKSVAMIACLI